MVESPLKKYREQQNPPLSQEQLAEAIGVSRVTVTRWESGKRKVGETLLSIVSEETGIPVAELRPDLAALLKDKEPVQ